MSCPRRLMVSPEATEFLEQAIAAGLIAGYDVELSEDGLTVNTTVHLVQPIKFIELKFTI